MLFKNARIFCNDFTFHEGAFEVVDGKFGAILPDAIPEDAIDHLFERFYRVDKARSRKSGGAGLGLAIVRNMVERNGGSISVESVHGVGSVFTVKFPVFDIEEDA
jgi:signal transduction histidine kinase